MHPSSRPLITGVGLGLLALLSLVPLILEPHRDAFLAPYTSITATFLAEVVVLFLMAASLGVRARLDRVSEPHAGRRMLLFVVLAGLMTLAHWLEVDRIDECGQWQEQIYLKQLSGDYEVPHNYRPLPQGFTFLLERVTHDWDFACLSYRWFFTTWFVWASYTLARRYLDPSRALLTLVPLLLLYPLSILHYAGQLTDPLSHTLFVLAFLYLLEDRPLALAATLALGIVAKETIVLVVPAYLACYGRRGWRTWLTTAALGVVSVAAFAATRLALGWRPGAGSGMNGAGIMIGTNLGFGEPIANLIVPLWVNYLHPLLFVGSFVPILIWRWGVLDPRLRTLCLVVAPLLLLSNVCYGWMYESRNYMPLLPLLATLSLPSAWPKVHSERIELQSVGA